MARHVKFSLGRVLRNVVLAALPTASAATGCGIGTCTEGNPVTKELDQTLLALVGQELPEKLCADLCQTMRVPCRLTGVDLATKKFSLSCAQEVGYARVVDGLAVGRSFLESETCRHLCGEEQRSCWLNGALGDSVSVECNTSYSCVKGIGGRRPAELLLSAATGTDVVGRFFSEAMQLEAASVTAFEILHDELARFDAPEDLRRAAVRAAGDEVRHAKTMRGLAKRFGGEAISPPVQRPGERSLFEMARENAVEGCVRETYAALVAAWQAEVAEDAHVRRAMRAIAQDELRHAELAWAVARWSDDRLGVAERADIAAARQEAIATLRAEMAIQPAERLVRKAGIPTHERAEAFLDHLAATIWA